MSTGPSRTRTSLFARYLFDDAYTTEPFYGNFPAWPELEDSRNQYFTVGEKKVLSDTVVNSLQFGYTNTFFDIRSQSISPTVTPGVLPEGSLNWSGDICDGGVGEPAMDGTLAPGLWHQRDRPGPDLADPKGAGPVQRHRRPLRDQGRATAFVSAAA